MRYSNRRLDKEISRVLCNNSDLFWGTSRSNEELLKAFGPDEYFVRRIQQEFEKFQRSEHPRYSVLPQASIRRAAVIIVSVALALGTVSFSVKAIREPIVQFFRQAFDRVTEFGWGTEDEDAWDKYFKNRVYWAPKYIPSGYVVETWEPSYGALRIVYKNDENQKIWYRQITIPNANVRLDTENVEVHEIMVNGQKAIWYKNKGYTNLFVYMETGSFRLYWKGSLEELIQMAESLEHVDEIGIK